MSHDYAAVARMGSDQLTAPSRIQKILPGFWRVLFGQDLGIVSHDRKCRPHAVVKAGLVLKAVGKTSDSLGREFEQHPFALKKLEVTGIGGINDIGILYSRRRFLH